MPYSVGSAGKQDLLSCAHQQQTKPLCLRESCSVISQSVGKQLQSFLQLPTAETELAPLFLFPKPHTPHFFSVSAKWWLRYKPREENQPCLASTHILWCWSCTSFRAVTLYLHHPEGKETIWLFSSSIPFPST